MTPDKMTIAELAALPVAPELRGPWGYSLEDIEKMKTATVFYLPEAPGEAWESVWNNGEWQRERARRYDRSVHPSRGA